MNYHCHSRPQSRRNFSQVSVTHSSRPSLYSMKSIQTKDQLLRLHKREMTQFLHNRVIESKNNFSCKSWSQIFICLMLIGLLTQKNMLIPINLSWCFWRNFHAKKQLFPTVTFVLEWEEIGILEERKQKMHSNFFKMGLPPRFTEANKILIIASTGNFNCPCKHLTISFQNKNGFNLFI